jgi:hypothetical protein
MVGMARHVDHLVVPVHDLGETAAALEGAGFVVTPRADHPFGTSNRLVVFADTYLELVAITRPELLPPEGFADEVRSYLDSGEGVSHVVVSCQDPAADIRLVAGAGLGDGEIFEFSRAAPRADGSVTQASFSIVRTISTAPLGAFLCAHDVPDAVWHESHLSHPNGARRIVGLDLPGPAPEVFAELEVAGVEFGPGEAVVRTDGTAEVVVIGGLVVGGSQ